LRTVRAESLRQTSDLQRLQEKHADAQRKLCINDAAEAALRTQLKTAEAGIRTLKDEAARTKVLVAQTRAACANEVRKRDRQIDGLKKAVADAGRARGERKASGITSIVVTGDVGSGGGGEGDLSSLSSPSRGGGGGGTDDDGYDLRMETNSFLAELARGLSEENETLLALVRKTTGRLKDMSGFPGEQQQPGDDGLAVPLAADPAELDRDLDAILEHLRTILTNPSFVPIEEVVVRDDEIHRLRDGWVKMEARWKEAVHLLDGWRRRMAVSGRSVNMEELKMGLRLSPVRVTNVEETAQGGLGLRLSTLQEEQDEEEGEEEERGGGRDEAALMMARIAAQSPCPAESLRLVAAPDYVDAEDDSDLESSIFEDDVDLRELDVEEPNVQILEQSMMIHSVDTLPLPPSDHPPPLRDSDSAGNRGAAAAAASHATAALRGRKRPGNNDFTTIVEENTRVLAKAAATPLPPSAAAIAPKRSKSPQKQAKPALAKENIRPTSAASQVSTTSTDSIQLVKSSQPSPGTTTTTKTSNTAAPPSAARPTQSSSLKQRAAAPQHDPSPRQPQRTSAKTAPAAQKEDSASPQQQPNPSSSTDMPPPPLPTPNPRSRSPAKPSSSRLPLPRPALPPPTQQQQPPPQRPLTTATIAAKLAASEREADAARVRAKLKAARLGKRTAAAANPPLPSASSTTSTIRTVSGASSSADVENSSSSSLAASLDPVKKPLPPPSCDEEDELAGPGPVAEAAAAGKRKRDPARRASKVASRRRSTLNPWELESLIAGSVGPA